MYFKQFFDDKLAQYAYLIGCQATGEAIVIDPMRDVDQYIEAAAKENLTITAAADTHIHADYVSGLREFAERGVRIYASDEGDADWKFEWLKGSEYNYQLLTDGDEFKLGNITLRAWHTPGHTPEHLSYFVTDEAAADEPLGLVTGDFIFVGDVGRPDLLESAAGMKDVMKPSARTLFKSVEAFKDLPEYLQVWPGHGAGSACGKAMSAIPESTVGYELRTNASIKAATSEEAFVGFILEGQPEPPLYFARMKRDNKIGLRLISGLPQPKRLTIKQLEKLQERENTVVLDTREKEDFMNGHLPGALSSPLNKQFNTVAGSYITEDETIFLVVEEHQVREAVTDLIRIGLDYIEGYVTPSDLKRYAGQGGKMDRIDTITFDQVDEYEDESQYQVVDVRKASEYQEEGHVPSALNIAHTRLLDRKDEIPADKRLVVHCQSGARSSVAGALLKRSGFDVKVVNDDFENYKKRAAVS